MEDDSSNNIEKEFVPDVPEFKENVPASKGEKSHTRPAYTVKPVSSQPVVKANSQKNKHPKTQSDEEVGKNYKGKTKIPYEITMGGRGDVRNVKEKVSDSIGDLKGFAHVNKKTSVLRTHGVLSDKQPATVVNNKVIQDSQTCKMSSDDMNLLKQIHNLKSIRKQNFRHPENEIAGKCNIECMQNYIKGKKYILQESIKANW